MTMRAAIIRGMTLALVILLAGCANQSMPGYQRVYQGYQVSQNLADAVQARLRAEGISQAFPHAGAIPAARKSRFRGISGKDTSDALRNGTHARRQATQQSCNRHFSFQITDNPRMNWLDEVKWDAQGLVPVIAQEQGSNDVLMFAWMNREALQKTAELGRAVYFSRSRARLWFKGEESGHVQTVHEIRIDCDNDVVLLKVTQRGHEPGIACHTGRHSCFFSILKDGAWQSADPVLKDPASIYK